MRRIRVMPPELAQTIAAGEVVERPSSVVKELIENALDAGATRILVDIRDGGLSLIRVADDGHGIPRADVPLAFESHATSKIDSLDDLERLATLGFRGEALPSIAQVATVELQTRSAAEDVGTLYRTEFGSARPIAATARPPGTTVAVTHLFGNVPARRKFVRSLRAEAAASQSVVAQYAQARPDVALSLTIDDRQTFLSPGSDSLEDAIAAAQGAAILPNLICLDWEEGGVRVGGVVSTPDVTRQNRSAISFFANGRPIANRSLGFALEEAYSGYLMTGRHPLAVVHLTIDPSLIDANVHPAKSEVRFATDRLVHGAVHHAVANALADHRAAVRPVGGLDYDQDDPATRATLRPLPEMDAPAPPMLQDLPALRVFGQTNAAFIVAEGPQGLYMIDQHAAHERILFDRLDAALDAGEVASQPLLEPTPVTLTATQMQALEDNGDLLRSTGFELEPFGDDACLVRSIPALAVRAATADLTREVLDELAVLPEPAAARERALAAMACKAAVKAGQTLDVREMREIVFQLERTPRPATCPHGRPTMIHLSHSQLEREFGRR
ncbi:MAG TPA: DNA mismatch repair endonuclease MutL [Chloroflexota bacterium]|nr:DNA mismatch repair endonuclease MutL [Chloroflexota bacterium]